MYSVSSEYLEQMMHHGTRRRLSGTVGSVAFTGNDVVQRSFSVSGRATEESDTKIGGVYLGEVNLTFVPSFLTKIPRDQFKGKEMSVSIGLWIPDEEELNGGHWEDVPVGVFTLQSPKISKQGITVNGYDHMYMLEKKFNIDTTSASPYGFLSYIATQCHVTLGNTEEEIMALPNGTEILGIYEENDIETYRDLLYWVAQTCGCFACADRAGNIVLRKFGVPNNVEFDENHRDANVVFSGYTTKWTGIYVVDAVTKIAMYYGLEEDDGLTMSLGQNPLLQLGSATAVERRRRAVLDAIAQIQYTPFYCNSARDPIFDLGDEINFTGGISGNSTGCIMSLDYTLTNYTFEGYGDDPALTNARSKTDKNISGLLQSTTENEVSFYNFTNLDAITFGSEQEVTLASLAFTSAQITTVKIMHEFIFDMLADLAVDGSYELRYYLDEELLSYKPYERLGAIVALTEGDITEVSIARDFFYVLKEIQPNIRHTWQVRIIAHGIDQITVQPEHAHVTLEGQRLYGDKFFDGFIEVREEFNLISIGGMALAEIEDEGEITRIDAVALSVTDELGIYTISSIELASISDSMQVFLEGGYYIATEDGKIITTEDGKGLITE